MFSMKKTWKHDMIFAPKNIIFRFLYENLLHIEEQKYMKIFWKAFSKRTLVLLDDSSAIFFSSIHAYENCKRINS